MFMDPTDIKNFPKCAALLQTLDSTLRSKDKKVFDAFVQTCLADDQTEKPAVVRRFIDQALKWGTGPRVDVHEGFVRATASGEVIDACGYQPPFGSAMLLIITSVWFDAFEFCTDVDRPRNAHRLTRTVLHEAVHWVRQQGKASDEVVTGGYREGWPRQEAGHAFETLAYGAENICTPDQILDALASILPSGERTMRARRQGKH